MIGEKESEFYRALRRDIQENPDWLLSAMQAIQLGMRDRLAQERHEKVEWETIALMSMEVRLFKSSKGWLAQKLEALKDTASCRWDHFIEELRK